MPINSDLRSKLTAPSPGAPSGGLAAAAMADPLSALRAQAALTLAGKVIHGVRRSRGFRPPSLAPLPAGGSPRSLLTTAVGGEVALPAVAQRVGLEVGPWPNLQQHRSTPNVITSDPL